MLAFVIPLRSKVSSRNWTLEVRLLERTIQSILNQTDPHFNIYLVYTDKPDINIIHPKLHFIQFPHPFLPFDHIIDIKSPKVKVYSPKWVEGEMDKGRKICLGCKIAIEEGHKYIMQVDADDLVSNRICSFVNFNLEQNKAGWYVDKGYIYQEGRGYLLKQPANMNYLNGSTNIIRADLVPIPDFRSHKTEDYFFFITHGYLKNRIKHMYNEEIEPLPFYANIYVVSGNNHSAIVQSVSAISIKNLAKVILRGVVLTSSIKESFRLYKIHS
jgi:hypothetical protein